LGNSSQIGFYAGLLPTMGLNGAQVTIGLSAEYRLYIGAVSDFTTRKQWFLRPGYTNYPNVGDQAFTFTVGKDLRSKKQHKGWTIDLGIFYLLNHDRQYSHFLPAARFQYYGFTKKSK